VSLPATTSSAVISVDAAPALELRTFVFPRPNDYEALELQPTEAYYYYADEPALPNEEGRKLLPLAAFRSPRGAPLLLELLVFEAGRFPEGLEHEQTRCCPDGHSEVRLVVCTDTIPLLLVGLGPASDAPALLHRFRPWAAEVRRTLRCR